VDAIAKQYWQRGFENAREKLTATQSADALDDDEDEDESDDSSDESDSDDDEPVKAKKKSATKRTASGSKK
jgi:hypothetical protein